MKINVSNIIRDHIKTLVNDNTKRMGLSDILTFILVPIAIASVLVHFKIYIDNSVNYIISGLAVFTGLLFNVLVIIFDILKRENGNQLRLRILQQVLSNISFTIFLSLFTIIIVLLTTVENLCIKLIVNWVSIFLLTEFVFTLLMILKRMYALFQEEFSRIKKDKGI